VKVTDDGVPVETLVAVVKNSIKRAGVSRVSEPGDLRVASVQLILEVVASKTAGGGLSFRVPFIGMKLDMGVKVTKKDTHTIDITLVPPEPQTSREVRGGEVEDVLVNAVATIRSVVAHAAEGDDPWVLSAGIVEQSRSEWRASWPTRSLRRFASVWCQAPSYVYLGFSNPLDAFEWAGPVVQASPAEVDAVAGEVRLPPEVGKAAELIDGLTQHRTLLARYLRERGERVKRALIDERRRMQSVEVTEDDDRSFPIPLE
jgi:hypothetical protein